MNDWLPEVQGRVPHRPKRRWWAVAARPMPQMPLDVITTPGVASVGAFGLRQLAARYVGPAINVQRSSDSAIMDIGFRGPGDLDVSTLANFISAGSGTINIWYDQSGQGNNLTVVASAPTVNLTGLNGKPTAVFIVTTNLHHATTPIIPVPFMTSAVVMRTSNFSAYNPIIGDDGGAQALYFNSSPNGLVLFDAGAITSPVACSDSIAHSLVAAFNAAASTITVDGTTSATTGSTGNSFVGLRLGVENGGLVGNLSEGIYWNGLMSAGDIAALSANQKAYWGTP